MHVYQGRYFLFTTFNAAVGPAESWPEDLPRLRRGTVLLAADSPLGPFKLPQPRPHTPGKELALDGTLWIEDGAPYMVYCHDGTFMLVLHQPNGGGREMARFFELEDTGDSIRIKR